VRITVYHEQRDIAPEENRWKLHFIDSSVAFWQRYRQNRAAVMGLLILLFFLAVALCAPLITTKNPLAIGKQTFQPPNWAFPMGTDDLGRDVFSGVLYGARVSLLVGFLAASTCTAIGVFVGAIAGFYGTKIDDFLMRITELFQVLPAFLLALIFVALFGRNILNIIFILGALTWPSTARLVRAEVLSLKERQFVEAAKALGASRVNILLSEILVNATPTIVVNGSLQVGRAILLEAGLSFLGVGDPTVASWGAMLNNASRMMRDAWWLALFPGIAISLLTIGVNLVGDGLNDSLNPKMKERGV
jgi:peptide/nickel transport system permease protein